MKGNAASSVSVICYANTRDPQTPFKNFPRIFFKMKFSTRRVLSLQELPQCVIPFPLEKEGTTTQNALTIK